MFLNDTLLEGDYLLEAFTGHSFFNDSTGFKAIRKINVRRDMEPQPSFTATFNKLFYKTGDTIKATLIAQSENDEPLYTEVEASLLEATKGLGKVHAVTNREGEATLNFILHGSGEGLRVEANIKYADKDSTLIFPVPYRKGSPIQFNVFPEGGNLIAGMPNKVGFKAVDIDGAPLDVTGTLFENESPLMEIKSAHAGMGSFDFTPDPDKEYYIHLSEPVTDSTFLLPKIYSEGITLHLAGSDKKYLNFIVSQSPGMAERKVYLRGQMRGLLCCMAAGMLKKELKIKIPLKEFPQQGIAEFTLYDENFLPEAGRLVFIHPDKKLYIETELDKEKYETREKVTLKINTKDENGQPVSANLGVSVFDKLYQNADDSKNILTHCYLSSQLEGRIYNPAYYFDEKNEEREDALDLLLLTQGWRRYIWSEKYLEMTKGRKQPVVFDWLEGEIEATKNKKKAKGVQQLVMAHNPSESEISDFIVADTSDKFMVMPSHLKTWQGGYFYLKPMSPEEFKPRISMASPFQRINEVMGYRKRSYPLPNFAGTKETPERVFIVAPNVIELGEVTIKGRTKKPFRDKYLGQLDSIAKIDLNDHWVCKHGFLHNYIEGYAHLTGANPPYEVCGDTLGKPVEGEAYQLVKYEDVGRSDGKWILTDLITIRYHYPNFTEEELLEMNNLCKIKAYYGEREFYQPNYDKETENDLIPDSRNTLLWAPSVITDKNGEATLEFFCSDINTGFVGKVEGVSGEGLLGTKDFEFRVLKTEPYIWEK